MTPSKVGVRVPTLTPRSPTEITPNAFDRGTELAHRWRVSIDDQFETESSVIAFGRRDDRRVVLKIVKRRGDEWHSGEVLRAFDGRGVARVLEHVEGAMLLERLEPGTSLAPIACDDRDEEATTVLAGVIASMSPGRAPVSCPTVSDWGRGFSGYLATGDAQVPGDIVRRAAHRYERLSESQRDVRLLHGDLQHYNILHDRERGWLAIDPKGVIGELEYELGAALRNPTERPDVFTNPTTIERRVSTLSSTLSLDARRITAWAFAQAVLSVIWGIEDGYTIAAENPELRLARTLEPMLEPVE
jgi:streptomycin 6-kinase